MAMDFEEFYKNTVKYAYSYVFKRIEHKEIAQDITQEIYIAFYHKYKLNQDLSEKEAVKILYGFCRNFIKNHYKKTSKNKEIVSFDESYHVNDEGETSHLNPHQVTLFKRVKAALHSLPRSLKQIITLRILQNKSRKECSQELGITEASVYTYQKRAMQQLRKILK